MSEILLWAAEQFIQVAVTDHLTALPFPEVILQPIVDVPEVLRVFGDGVTAVVLEGPLVTSRALGRQRWDTQEGAQQQQQRRDHLHSCQASHSRVLKRNEVCDTAIAAVNRPLSLICFLPCIFLSCEALVI